MAAFFRLSSSIFCFIRLLSFINLAPSPLEKIEKLEQLRVLWHGEKIKMARACEIPAHGVDTPEDLAKVRALFD